MLQFFMKNKLIATNQSSFKLGVSCINQLLSITLDICKSFDERYEVKKCSLIYGEHLIRPSTKVLFSN